MKLLNPLNCHSQGAIMGDQAPGSASTQNRRRDIPDARISELALGWEYLNDSRYRTASLLQRIVHVAQDLSRALGYTLPHGCDCLLSRIGSTDPVP